MMFIVDVGWIRNPINKTTLPDSIVINQGAISDCERYKLEIRMPTLDDMSEFHFGMHVRVRIKIRKYPYLNVLRKEDIRQASDDNRKCKFSLVMKGSGLLEMSDEVSQVLLIFFSLPQ